MRTWIPAQDSEAAGAVRRLGRWSAALCSALALVYIVAQLAEWQGLLGSTGGPHASSTPPGLAVLMVPSLLLSLSFVVLMVGVHQQAAPAVRIWSHLAVVFAAMYATLVGIVYYVQLAFVVPRLLRGDADRIDLLRFRPFDSFLYAVDVYGYGLMSLSTLFAAAVFGGPGPERWIRRALLANGCLLPFLVLQVYWPPLIWGGSLWAITFPASTLLLLRYFGRLRVSAAS